MSAARLAATLSLDGLADPAALLDRFRPYGERAAGEAGVALRLYDAAALIRVEDARLVAVAQADEAGALATMKHMIAHTIAHGLGPGCPPMRWTGEGAGSAALPQFREMRVVGARNLGPRLRRVRLAGEDLARFAKGGLHVRLLIPPAGRGRPVWPHAGPAAIPVWPGGEDRLTARTYTIRRIDADRGTVDVDVVLHERPGPGGAWARSAAPGSLIGMMGPGGGGTDLPERNLALLGDETALPAIARILEALPNRATGVALVEIHDDGERQPLRHPPGVAVRWLSRGGRSAGSTTLLADALAALAPAAALAPDAFVWSGSEFASFKALRRHCRRELRLGRARHCVAAYWRRGAHADAPDRD